MPLWMTREWSVVRIELASSGAQRRDGPLAGLKASPAPIIIYTLVHIMTIAVTSAPARVSDLVISH